MDIRVDSPTTINHNYPEAPSLPEADDKPPAEVAGTAGSSRRSWLLPVALAIGSAWAGGGIGWVLAYQGIKAALTSTPPPGVHHDTTRRIDIELYIPPK